MIDTKKLFDLLKKKSFDKEAVETLINEGVTSTIEEGHDVNAIRVWAEKLRIVSEAIIKHPTLKEHLIEEIGKFDGDTFSAFNFEFSIHKSARYNYENDQKWVALQRDLKAREKFLKAVPHEGTTEVDEETGDVVKVYPALKMTSESPKLTFKA